VGRSYKPVGWLIILSAVLCALLAPGAVRAQSDEAKQKARAHMKQAEAYLKTEAYEKAVEEYQAAYKAVPRPGFLFNIGLTYERAGDKQKALEQYGRYLDLAPEGTVATEARARVAALEEQIATEQMAAAAAEAAKAAAEKRRLKGEAHVEAANALIAAKQWDEAIVQFSAAYGEHAEPEYVYRLAEVLHLKGDLPLALVEYERYRELAPAGMHSAAALEKIAALKHQIESAAKPKSDQSPKAGAKPKAPTQPGTPSPDAADEDDGWGWWWLGIGAAVIVAGVVTDHAPAQAKNGDFDSTDVIPVFMYAGGAALMIVGFF